ncbi:MAG: GNAT family N-acetyltransferase [Alphaproteobacteria bacterium]|nr:GNAT family N-acetyltransferase [Alphaproteobacteria bacterium]
MKMATDLNVPVLETPRLILRGHTLDDFEASTAIWSDPVVCRFFHGGPMTREDIWGRLLRTFGMWAAFGYGSWAVEEKETGDYIGRVGVAAVQRDLDPALEGMPETGWTLASRVHGRGYATEATQAALAWTDGRLGNPRMFCIIAPQNRASIRVAEKCGFRFWRETTYKAEATLILLRDSTAGGG